MNRNRYINRFNLNGVDQKKKAFQPYLLIGTIRFRSII